MIKINDKIKQGTRCVVGLFILVLFGLEYFFGISWLLLQLLGLLLTVTPSLYYMRVIKNQKEVLFYGMLIISLLVKIYLSNKIGLYIALINVFVFTLYEIYQRNIKKRI